MIRVFIGTDSSIHADAELVVRHSILKHTNSEVNIVFMNPGWSSGCTGFTNHRFLVPQLCNYEGYAIYLDVDMLVLADIQELWDYKTPGQWCTTPMRDDVSVIDCSAFRFLTEDYVKANRKDNIRAKIPSYQNIPEEWNTCDKVTPEAKLIHYTDLKTQPWRYFHPNKEASELFFRYLKEAKNV